MGLGTETPYPAAKGSSASQILVCSLLPTWYLFGLLSIKRTSLGIPWQHTCSVELLDLRGSL